DIGISVPTPLDWIANSMKSRPKLEYFYCDGLNLFDTYKIAKECRAFAARTKRPCFFHMKTVRLLGHAGSDVETLYHTSAEIEETEFNDALLHSARICLENNDLSKEELINF